MWNYKTSSLMSPSTAKWDGRKEAKKAGHADKYIKNDVKKK